MQRALLVALGLSAALLLALGGMTAVWWIDNSATNTYTDTRTSDELQATIGLRSMQMCRAQKCATAPLDKLKRDLSWLRAGVAAYTAALLACGLLLALTAALSARRTIVLLGRTALVASLSALITGVWFVWSTPTRDDMSPGYSMLMYFAGAVLGTALAIIELRRAASAPTPAVLDSK